MLSARPWIGIALLGVSWLLGLDYYETASPWAQAVVLILGAWMLAAGEQGQPLPATRGSLSRIDRWPSSSCCSRSPGGPPGPIACRRWRSSPGSSWNACLSPGGCSGRSPPPGVTGGVILLAQSVVLTLYAAVTARSHDLPGVLVKLLAGLCRLAGIDAAADGPLLVVQSMRQSHRLAISWDMVFDPATLMFLVGGLAWITIDAGRLNSIRLRWAEWGWTLARFALDRGRLAADPRDPAAGPLSASRRR